MKMFKLVLTAALVCMTADANAWFFFFLPGSVTSKIGDVLTGAEGENCVKSTAKVGDVLTSSSGNTATIKSLSGTSSRCQDPNLPTRALLNFNYSFSSKAGIDIPDGFEQMPLTDIQRFQGNLLRAENTAKKIGFFVSSKRRDPSTDVPAVAQGIATKMISSLEEGKTLNEDQLTVNGMKTYRFEIAGKSKALFHPKFTYVVTLLEAQEELVIVNAWTPTDDYGKNLELLRQLAFRVSGVNFPANEQAAVLSAPASEASSNPTAPEARVQSSQSAMTVPVSSGSAPIPQQSDAEAVANKIRALDRLFKDGILIQSEYEIKKKELLKSL